MLRGDRDQDNICAVSTPHGIGGISVVRLSGPQAFFLIKKLAVFLPEKLESHRIYFGTLSDHTNSKKIDEVLISCFHKGKSYTGDETVEISCHGNPVITSWILQELIILGARSADRGEFTYRAFINGNVDLIQAESVLSIIESQSRKSSEQALMQLKGNLSSSLKKIEDDILWCLTRLEVSIDFSTEDIEIISNKDLSERLIRAQAAIVKLLSTYKSGKIINDGINIVLIGRPNVGKSSLLNLLSGEEKAIVTDIPGTTRDLIETSINYNGFKIKLTDTAGLHEAVDVVEKIGIEKTKKILSSADIILFIYDLSVGFLKEDIELIELLNPINTFILGNKSDLISNDHQLLRDQISSKLTNSNFYSKIQNLKDYFSQNIALISTKDEKSLTSIYKFINEFINLNSFEDQTLVFQSRHFENLSKVNENIERALLLVKSNSSAEFMSLELKEALILLHETLGKRFDDQIMDQVFKEFCIGK